jgi:hypothetical protein
MRTTIMASQPPPPPAVLLDVDLREASPRSTTAVAVVEDAVTGVKKLDTVDRLGILIMLDHSHSDVLEAVVSAQEIPERVQKKLKRYRDRGLSNEQRNAVDRIKRLKQC